MERALEQIRQINDVREYFASRNRKRRIEDPIRDWDNPMESFTEIEFRRKFRFEKSIVFHVLLPLTFATLNATHGAGLSPLLQLLVALRWFSSNSFQDVIADTVSISQASVCRIVCKVAKCFASLRPRFIYFPNQQQADREKANFRNIAGFPDVLGCIDCTHVKILRPAGVQDSEVFRNRKGAFSINVQACCNSDLTFSNVVARWPGSTNDKRIMENSRLDYNLRTGNAPAGHLLGDGGYTLCRYVLTPYREDQLRTDAEKRYNASHIKTRNCIERAFGVLKKRFHCLATELRTMLPNTLAIIVACMVLHNIAVRHNQPLDADEDDDEFDCRRFDPEDENVDEDEEGSMYRQLFTRTHFHRPEDDNNN